MDFFCGIYSAKNSSFDVIAFIGHWSIIISSFNFQYHSQCQSLDFCRSQHKLRTCVSTSVAFWKCDKTYKTPVATGFFFIK